ncbi:MAG TPA: hypothetical protein VFX23_15500, partial [Limnobacter sp.]|uniref:hypothetical protein n=1 Tax=Limnobacter sp. TaxID=2003368 RepID=UPI002E32E6F5
SFMVLNVFILLMAIGALGVLGVGQAIWKKNELQRIVDLTAQVAASDIADASINFPAAYSYAAKNGYDAASGDTLSISCNVKGTDTLLSANNCGQSVLVKITRTLATSFLGTHTITAQAEATIVPMVTGAVGTNLLALSTSGSALLSPVLSLIGTKLQLNAIGYQGLLAANTSVSLVGLAVQLGVIQAGQPLNLNSLLSTQVTARQLLDAAFTVSNVTASDLGLTLPSGGALNNKSFPLSDILAATNVGTVSNGTIRLGDLGFVSTLAAAAGVSAGTIKLKLGSIADVTVLSPPKMFIAVKRPTSGSVLATATTEQIQIHVKLSGLVDVTLTSGGGKADINDIQCRLPQSNSSISSTLYSVPLTASVVANPLVNLSTQLGSVSASNVQLVGYPNPTLKTTYSFDAIKGTSTLTSNLTAQVLGLNLGILNAPLTAALSGVGPILSELLADLGLDVNQVVLEENTQNCFNTAVLTR